MGRKLHIGGHKPNPEWEILDVMPGEHVDHVGNANDLSRFDNGAFAEVYASHVVEHLDYKDELGRTLKEWFRILRPGGVLRVSVPDLDILAHLMLQRRTLDVNQRFKVMRMMFGGHMHAHDYHLVGLNQEFLSGFLTEAGFVNLRRVTRHGLFQDTSESQIGGTLISLSMTAETPQAVTDQK